MRTTEPAKAHALHPENNLCFTIQSSAKSLSNHGLRVHPGIATPPLPFHEILTRGTRFPSCPAAPECVWFYFTNEEAAMPLRLVILKILFWIVGFVLMFTGVWFTLTHYLYMASGWSPTFWFELFGLLLRIALAIFGLFVMVFALSAERQRDWVWRLGIVLSSLLAGTVVLIPVGAYGLLVLNSKEGRTFYTWHR
jgi:hypothetical protein